jgi:hypothetical protein
LSDFRVVDVGRTWRVVKLEAWVDHRARLSEPLNIITIVSSSSASGTLPTFQ